MKKPIPYILIAIAVLILAALWFFSSPGTENLPGNPNAESSEPPSREAIVAESGEQLVFSDSQERELRELGFTVGSIFGVREDGDGKQYLTDPTGRTLYVFLKDKKNESACYDACAEKWPPYLMEEPADVLPGGVTIVFRSDGGFPQYSYKGQPLYYYAGDANPGEMNGEGVNDAWSAARP